LIAKAVYDACAGEDGLIEDPGQCGFKPASLECKGADGPDCLTAAEVKTLEMWYAGPRNSSGEQIFPGVPLGSEPYWSFWLSGEDEETWRGDKEAIQHTLRFYGFAADPGPGYDVINFDFDKDPQVLAQTYVNREASGTDLSKFKARGGKLLVYHGMGDPTVSETTRQWYETLRKEMGGEAATMEFARLFLVPGMDHCGVLYDPGVDQTGFDPLSALEKWVEEGVPPESIVMIKSTEDGKTEWTRPVCVYPKVATYKGSGDLKDAANWTCGGA
jgi:Tannase and feruloyl esterase